MNFKTYSLESLGEIIDAEIIKAKKDYIENIGFDSFVNVCLSDITRLKQCPKGTNAFYVIRMDFIKAILLKKERKNFVI